MTALLTTVFLASLLGSLHCAGMCGAFVAFAVGLNDPEQQPGSRVRLQIAYNGGRLLTYTALGVLGGYLGSAVDLGGNAIGLQRLANIIAATALIVFGGICLARIHGVKVRRLGMPRVIERFVGTGYQWALRLRPVHRALTIGLLTTLLPCGWLYAFAITAAGTADPLLGGLTMMAFWCGTLPVLISLGTGIQSLAGRFGRAIPTVMASAIIIVGVFTVFRRAQITMPAQNSARDTALSPDALIQQVRSIDHEQLPCCAPESEESEH